MKKTLFLLTICFSVSIVFSSCQSNNEDANYNKHLLAYFEFQENNQSLLIDSLNNIDPVNINYHLLDSSTIKEPKNVQFKDGIFDDAMVFDGYSTFASIDSSELMIAGSNFSIGAWIAPRAYNWSDQNSNDDLIQAIASQYYKDDSFAMGFQLGYRRDGKVTFGVGTENGWYQLYDEGSPINRYQWNHILATFDGVNGSIRLYVNGKIVNRLEIEKNSKIVGCDLPLLIGKNTVSTSSGDCSEGVISGLLDELRLYDSTLSYEDYKHYYSSCLVNGKIKDVNFEDVWIQNTLTDDLYKPQYHGGPYEHWMNEPHAPIYYNGVYHLFFQFNENGPYFNDAKGIAWGHLTSTDMVEWTPRKEVIVPTANTVCPDGVWSGGATYDKDGVPVLFFTAGDYVHSGMISNQNIGLATPKDISDPYLTEWVVSDELAIEQKSGQGRSGEFRDCHLIQDGENYYMLIGSGDENSNRGTILIYTTNTNKNDYFHNWEYKGHLFDYANNDSKYGTSWELPVLLPLKDENGNDSEKWVLIISPAPASTADNNIIYWIGEFNKETCRFVADFADPRRIDYGKNVFTGPSGFVDPNTGEATMFSIMQSQRESSDLASSGWSHNVGLTRRLRYNSKTNDLSISIIDDVSNLSTGVLYDASNCSISEINQAISNIESDMFNIKIVISNLTSKFSIKTRMTNSYNEYTLIYADPTNDVVGAVNTLNLNNSSLSSGEFIGNVSDCSQISIDLYVDRSQIEVVFNSEKTISCRSYPKDLNALLTQLEGSEDIVINSFVMSQMRSIF